MLTKATIIDKIEVLEDGHIQVREATYILEDGKRIAGPSYHRSVMQPGEATTDKSARIAAVAAAVWTPEVITAFEDAKVARAEKMAEDIKGA